MAIHVRRVFRRSSQLLLRAAYVVTVVWIAVLLYPSFASVMTAAVHVAMHLSVAMALCLRCLLRVGGIMQSVCPRASVRLFFNLYISWTNGGILMKLITINQCQVHMTSMTLTRSLIQRSRSARYDHRNMCKLNNSWIIEGSWTKTLTPVSYTHLTLPTKRIV